jgi:hypothetical protein
MNVEIEIAVLSGVLQRVLGQSGRAILYDCRASKRTLAYAPDSAASPSGLLPAFLSAGDAVWREAAGKSLGVEIATDPCVSCPCGHCQLNQLRSALGLDHGARRIYAVVWTHVSWSQTLKAAERAARYRLAVVRWRCG